MATLRAISLRLKSVKSIQKITKSMKMVSAAKYARAERELKAARPMGEGISDFLEKADLTKVKEEQETDLDQKKKNLIYIAVTSDRGLCGAVHTTVARYIRNSITKSKDEVKIVCIGDKSRGILNNKFGHQFLFVCSQIGRLPPTFLDACLIVNEILQSDYEYDMGKIIFNKYRSAVSYVTSEITMYSLNTIITSQNIHNFEETDDETLKCFAEFSMAELLFYALKEAACSEQAARMTAMDGASKNAGEMIQGLTLAFNRTRQAVITRELIEIISGASAV